MQIPKFRSIIKNELIALLKTAKSKLLIAFCLSSIRYSVPMLWSILVRELKIVGAFPYTFVCKSVHPMISSIFALKLYFDQTTVTFDKINLI